MMITGMCGRRSCSLLAAGRCRLAPGMRMSDTSTCGASSSSARRHSAAEANARTSKPSRASAFSSTQRIDWSSSTIQTAFMCSSSLQAKRQQDAEVGASWLALAFDQAAVLLHEGLCQSQPEPASAVAARHQRERRSVRDLLRHARTIVDHMQVQCQPASDARQSSPVARSGCAAGSIRCPCIACAALRTRLSSAWIICSRVATKLGQAGVVVADDVQALRELGQHHRAHPLADLVDVHVADVARTAMRRQQPVDQHLQTVGLLDDDLRVFAQRRRAAVPIRATAPRRGCRRAGS